MSDFNCDTCYDTKTIDARGAEVGCPDCAPTADTPLTVKLTGLRASVACEGTDLFTVEDYTATTITLYGTRGEILADVRRNANRKKAEAARAGLKGRNYISSGAIALAKRVNDALA